MTQNVEDAHPTAWRSWDPAIDIGADHAVPFHATAFSVPAQIAMQNDGPAHDNVGAPVAPDAPPVSVPALHAPDR